MNVTTLLAAIKTRLIAQTWTGGGSVVFPTGSVAITRAIDNHALAAMRTPICLVMPASAQSDPMYNEEPDLIILTVNIRIITAIPGDAVGENPLQGANKTGGTTASEGRGIFEIEQELYNAVGKLNANEGLTIQYRQMGAAGAEMIPPDRYTAYQDYIFEAIATAT